MTAYGSIKSRIVACLEVGPATTAEIALDAGLTSSRASAYMRQLEKRGMVSRGKFHKPAAGRGRKVVSLWRFAEAGET